MKAKSTGLVETGSAEEKGTVEDVAALKRTREKLASIQREVEDFHPLLKELLPRLPHITDCEYRQGPHEMGADFVLLKQDPTLELPTYVGVIVKVGRITQDYSEIERQIKECDLPRKFRNGKTEIRLSEIWVVNNSTITNNAQQKIHEAFANKSVMFIDGERVAKLISKHAPYCWHDLPPTLSAYLDRVVNRLQEMDRLSSLLATNDQPFFIELDVVEVRDPTKPLERREAIPLAQIGPANGGVTLIEADMGSGKSKLLRQIAQFYADALTFQEQRVLPVLGTCREIAKPHDCDLEAFIKASIGEVWELREQEGFSVLLLIDGLDEALNSAESEVLSRILRNAADKPWLRVVIASRPSPYLESATSGKKELNHLEIRPLSLQKVSKFIERVCESFNVSTRLLEDVRRSELFRQLPQTPIAAILLSRLITEDRQDLPAGLTELYDKSIELMLGRWDIRKGLETDKEYTAATNICGELAQYILDNDLEALNATEAKGFFTRYLEERNLEVDTDDLFEKVTNRSGVLVRDDRKGVVRFRHRSFAEFLYAKSHKEHGKTLAVDGKYFHVYWQTSRFFYVGLLRDCPDLLRDILGWAPSDTPSRWMKLLCVPSYLLAALASPYTITEQNLHKVLLDAADLYLTIKRTGEGGLNRLSEGQLLWLFQALMRHAFAFRFFQRAIESAAIQILDGISAEEHKQYALFFLAVIARDLDNKQPMELLAKHYDIGRLPLALAALTRIELMAMEKRDEKDERPKSPLLHKALRRMNKLLNNSQQLSTQLKSILEVPLNAPVKMLTPPGGYRPKKQSRRVRRKKSERKR